MSHENQKDVKKQEEKMVSLYEDMNPHDFNKESFNKITQQNNQQNNQQKNIDKSTDSAR